MPTLTLDADADSNDQVNDAETKKNTLTQDGDDSSDARFIQVFIDDASNHYCIQEYGLEAS